MLVLIPARSGSKGLPGKHLLPLAGAPVIARPIAAAVTAQQVSRVVVTTDDPEIMAAALNAGAEAPFLRPAELAGDDVSQGKAVAHALEMLEAGGEAPIDSFCVVQANSPFVTADQIDACIKRFGAEAADAAITMAELARPIEAVFSIADNGRLRNVLAADYGVAPRVGPRQALGRRYIIAGSVLVMRRTLFNEDENYFYHTDRCIGVPVPEDMAVDLDTHFDYRLACALAASISPTDGEESNL